MPFVLQDGTTSNNMAGGETPGVMEMVDMTDTKRFFQVVIFVLLCYISATQAREELAESYDSRQLMVSVVVFR